MNNIIAIDPGKSGGFAWWDGNALKLIAMPDQPSDIVALVHGFLYEIRTYHDLAPVFVLEHLWGNVGGRSSPPKMFAMGENYGLIRGAIYSTGHQQVKVVPSVWMKKLKLKKKPEMSTSKWKNHLKNRAIEIWGHQEGMTLKTADAALILKWAMLQGDALV